MRNPLAKPYLVLGKTLVDWTALLDKVRTYLAANADKEELSEATLRALDPALADPRLWNEIKRELGLR